MAAAAPVVVAQSDFARDLARARWDIGFFSERFLGIKPHPGQDRLWRAILARDLSGWRPRFLDINAVAGNRAGKTLGIAVPMFHSTLFKMGLEPGDPRDEASVRRWLTLPYEWYHFALQQEIAELAYIEITRILQGIHEAQQAGCPLTQMVGTDIATWDRKYRGEYLWIKLHEAFGGGELHFRTTGERAIGQLGKDMNGWSYDEAGFDPHMVFILNEVLHMRRLSTGGQGWVIGTPTEGLTDFADRWEEGNPDAPDRKPDSYSVRISTRENIGFGIDQAMFDRIVASMPVDLIPQNIDGQFIQGSNAWFDAKSVDVMFDKDLPEAEASQEGGNYVQGVDPANRFDSTWSLVLKVEPNGGRGVRAERTMGRTTGPSIAALATNAHNAYNVPGRSGCVTGVDATGFGGKMFVDLLPIVPPVRAIEFGGTRGRKLKLLIRLKQWIEQGKLKFPRSGIWLVLRRQLLGYRLDDKDLDTDAVMALAIAVEIAEGMPAGSVTAMPFDYFHSGTKGVSFPSQIGPAGPRLRRATYRSLSEFLREG